MWRECFRSEASQLGIFLNDAQVEQFAVYLEELQRWNRSYNLTTITAVDEIVKCHFLDSLNYGPALGAAARVMDLGSGAGFPGLPLALIFPEKNFVLVDARQKKTLFLTVVSRLLGLKNVEILHLHLDQRNAREIFPRGFTALVSRAVKVRRELIPLASVLLVSGGRLIFTDAHPDRQELELELKNWPDLVLEGLAPTQISGRAPSLFLGAIRKE
ncbi:MAG TPA: 16S rRNA (guanine(527)-N(7))-methyltransferase RsmG [Proteobacteria bacterium]|nr:16S rRNA (guanine(527)-N(7))-methyltransferase RsmG [Pseudomonadota bacterium]